MLIIFNTHPDFFWLTNYLESVMSSYLWKPTTSATTARAYRKILDHYAKKTGTAAEFVQFQGHDFSFRGMSNPEDAALSGAGHLLSFVGTDSVLAIDLLEQYYGADAEKELVGCSVPATEHSVMCMGSKESEIDTFRRLINEVYPSGIVSIVSDTWDFWRVVTEYVATLKSDILARNGKVVIRPDSGDPVKIICGDEESRYLPAFKGAVECLWDIFGGTITETGHKLLDSHIGLIYGDSITPQRAIAILEGLESKGFASGNVVFGIGSFTYQYVTRDTYGFAVKSTYGEINGEPREIFKDPITDNGVKKSAVGLISVLKDSEGNYCLHDKQENIADSGELLTVFRNGSLVRETTLSEIRTR
jgi:nicotinamide phosphoribosyltransferase